METDILQKLVAISTTIYETQRCEELFEALDRARALLGFDAFLLSCRATSNSDVIIKATLTSFPDSFRHDYDRLNWVDGDLYTDRARRTDRVFSWNCEEEQYSNLRHQGYMDFLRTGPIRNGIIAPIQHRPNAGSVFAMARLDNIPSTPKIESATRILANFAIAKAERLGLCPTISADEAIGHARLSSVQRDVLGWVAEGKSNLDIATILGISERAVRHHVSEILRKFGVVSRTQAAAIFQSGRLLP